MGKFGSDTMTIGEANVKVTALNGVRVRVKDDVDWSRSIRTGTIYNVLVNPVPLIIQIWVNMDGGSAHCFRPDYLDFEVDENQAKAMAELGII